MNTPNPLVPQGSLQNQPGKGKSSVKLAVVSIIAVHVVFFGGLLLQGCKRDAKGPGTASNTTNNIPLTFPVETNAPTTYVEPTNTPQASIPASPVTPPPTNVVETPPVQPPVVAGEAKEYTIVKGDVLGKIAKANGITLTALLKANPNIDARKLKVGQKITIPAAAPAAGGPTGAGTGTGLTGATAEGGTSQHVVKGGETLTKIAHQHGTTVKAIRAVNGLKTDRLTVGQKLKIPAGKGSETAKVPTTGTTNP